MRVVNLTEFSLFRLYRTNDEKDSITSSLKRLYNNQFNIEEHKDTIGKIDTQIQLNHTFDMLMYNEKEVIAVDFSFTKPNELHYQGANFILEQMKDELKVSSMRYLLFNMQNNTWETMDYKGREWVLQRMKSDFLSDISGNSDVFSAAE